MEWHFIDWIGLIGGVLLLFGFWRTSIGKWKTTSLWYELDNVLGCTFLLIYAWQKHAYVNAIVNLIWAIIAFRGISSFAERRQLNKNKSKK